VGKITGALFLLLGFLLTACNTTTQENFAPVGEISLIDPIPKKGTHRVLAGETLYSIAWRYGLDYNVMAKRNRILPPYHIQTGQLIYLTKNKPMAGRHLPIKSNEMPAGLRVRGPEISAGSQFMDPEILTGPQKTSTETAAGHSMENAEATTGHPIRNAEATAGRPMRNTEAATGHSMGNAETAAGHPIRNAEATTERPMRGTEIPRSQMPSTRRAFAALEKEPSAQVYQWHWPARGPLNSRFSSMNKGINIGGALGTSITATAAGKVVYSGNGLRGYGNLIIIKHNKTFLTAYAYNSKILVNEGDWVRAGQKIAEMGDNGASKVMLHFEIRRNGQPVDPLHYLDISAVNGARS